MHRNFYILLKKKAHAINSFKISHYDQTSKVRSRGKIFVILKGRHLFMS